MDKKPKMTHDALLELLVVILLGVAALLTAWASWIGSLHGGNQATNYTTSNNLASEGNSEYNAGIQGLTQDMMPYNEINALMIDYTFAQDRGEEYEMEGFVDTCFEAANDLLAQSEEALEQGQKDNEDAFGLVTVIYSVVLFLLSITGTFSNERNKIAILCISGAAFLIAAIYMLAIPMPTGFSLTSFFGGR